jgi:hypothetical protein
MDVRMMMQVLTPGVEHGDETDLGPEVLRVGGDRAQGLGGGAEQNAVDHLLILEGDLGHRRRQREDDMEIRHRQQLGLARGEPFGAGLALALRAMPVAAGIVGDADQAAIRTLLRMAAERCRPTQLDGAHHAPLDAAEVTVMGAAIGGTVAAEDIRHFQSGRHGAAPSDQVRGGGTTSSACPGRRSRISRSSGLSVRRMSPFETRV